MKELKRNSLQDISPALKLESLILGDHLEKEVLHGAVQSSANLVSTTLNAYRKALCEQGVTAPKHALHLTVNVMLLSASLISVVWYWSLLMVFYPSGTFEDIVLQNRMNVTPLFVEVITPVLVILGYTGHSLLRPYPSIQMDYRNDKIAVIPRLLEKIGAIALVFNFLAGGFSGSFVLCLYALDTSLLGIIGFTASWVTAIYTFKSVIARLKLNLVTFVFRKNKRN